ncbi:hypothetical protein [Cyanobium sp. WAJ14-Wanaka]|uniref:hypothetical protein n=1 Tax=Cyanobium sp. WAJ14-Wanaka TaxID=2823725 RepID=UPI0020CF724A|nr:hypothetical protein [Cyanobium sp. WAJ14-Wanaka]MCP9774688.1 hypothetical protein [Cyanobium sp. WAJ14-Wanaka]
MPRRHRPSPSADPGLLLPPLSQRQRLWIDQWLAQLEATPDWSGRMPVALLDRCWLQLRAVPVERLAAVLPPDSSADAPELVRYRELIAAGLNPWTAQLQCWQDFGQPACQQAQQRFWSLQDQGNNQWTLQRYLELIETYRGLWKGSSPRQLPLLVLARAGQNEAHQLLWIGPGGPPMRHTCL